MPELKRHVVTLEATDTEPVDSSTDPFDGTNVTEAIKLGAIDDFEEDPQTTEDAIGREIDGRRVFQQEYFVREDSDSTITDEFVDFCQNNNEELWLKETYDAHEIGGDPVTKLIGAPTSGCTVSTHKASVDGFVGTMVKVTSASILEGEGGNYRDEPTYI